MKVRGNTNPGTAPRIEQDVGRTGYIAVRFAENIAKLDGEENLWEYDEYLISALEVNRADIEANPAKWLDLAKYWEAKRDAARAAALRDAELAQELPELTRLSFVAAAESGAMPLAQAAAHGDAFADWAKSDWRAYKLHAIRRHNGKLWRFNQPSLANETQNVVPGTNETIWSEIDYQHGARTIPDTITATKAFAKNELGYWHGSAAAQEGIYAAIRDGETWPPGTIGVTWDWVRGIAP